MKKTKEKITPVIMPHTSVGMFQSGDGACFIRPDDKKLPELIYIPAGKTLGAVSGHMVAFRITRELHSGSALGEVLAVIGHKNDPGIDILSIITAHNVPHEFPSGVPEDAAAVPNKVTEADIEGRSDFRSRLVITIDGEDAKDLDDAVSLEETGDGWRLSVHIADVAHYVHPGSELDKEAFKRGTSVYLADRVIPMLPHKLSNGICSLNAGQDRLALSCIMEINKKGWVLKSEICESVINVNKRMTYTEVSEILESRENETECALRKEYAWLVSMIDGMGELSLILRENRAKRGAIELESGECKILLDEKGMPTDIVKAEENAATSVIEEFMILCNETVARTFAEQGAPFIYRTHEEPEAEKLERLISLAKSLGFKMNLMGGKKGRPRSKQKIKPVYTSGTLQKLLERAADTPFRRVIGRVTLGSMQQARYTAENIGHYGLASRCYCHFTSPIRRYPDLWNHRIIKAFLHGKLTDTQKIRTRKGLPEVCRLLSAAERRAVDTERDVENLKKIQFMHGKLGKVYDGVISGVKNWGFYVELENTVEGLVSLRSITDDYYIVDEENWLVYGERTRKIYRLGDSVRVCVASADPGRGRLDFTLV